MPDNADRVILVFGGAGGIGRAVVDSGSERRLGLSFRFLAFRLL